MTIKQYAKKVGKHRDTVQQKIYRGKLPAIRVGSVWLIDSETPYIDHRTKEHYDHKVHENAHRRKTKKAETE